eukprot:2794683-Alexandrium_andersonii.AAC.1
MSASLVGSEMCIRDRPPPDGRRTMSESALTGQLCAPLRGAQSCYVKASSTICLLYTSDAADDMQ